MSRAMNNDERARAIARRDNVLGPRPGSASAGPVHPIVAAWEDYLTEDAWGGVWARPGISLKLRSLITVVILAVMGKSDEMEGHLVGALRNGWTPEELREVFIHVSRYAGYPAAVGAFRVAGRVFDHLDDIGVAAPESSDAQTKPGDEGR
jgi:4-carboxymuconolactone decarboxylase